MGFLFRMTRISLYALWSYPRSLVLHRTRKDN
jgi:hypothetical protein